MEKRMVTEETSTSDHIYSQNSNIEMVTVTRGVLLQVYFDIGFIYHEGAVFESANVSDDKVWEEK